jgi:hypothetical protein
MLIEAPVAPHDNCFENNITDMGVALFGLGNQCP